jgi:lipocalin
MLLVFAAMAIAASAATCPPSDFSTVDNFDLDTYISKRWYVQQQMECALEPKNLFQCQYAEYAKMNESNWWGFNLQGHDHIDMPDGTAKDLHPCAKVVDQAHGKLMVGECFLPTFFAGPYWVLAYNETEGYAAVSGGPPTLTFPGGCRVGTGHIKSGLWIFSRAQLRDESLVQKVRAILAAKGFDLAALADVDQTQCPQLEQHVVSNAVFV